MTTPGAPAPAAAPTDEPGPTLAEMSTDTSFLMPRGKFKIQICEAATVLVGKSSSIVVPHASITRVFLLAESSTAGGDLLFIMLSSPVANGKSTVSHLTLYSKPN